jgi:uncharacterized protein
LDVEPLMNPSSGPSPSAAPNGTLNKIFLNERGLRGIWRLLIYGVFVTGLGFLGLFVLQLLVDPKRRGAPLEYWFPYEALCFGVVFGASLIMAQIEGQSPGVYGLPLKGAFGRLFWQGCLIGLVEISALMGSIAAFGGYSFGEMALHGIQLLRWALFWAVLFLFVGLFEEFSFRGYTQHTLGESIGFWPAAFALSLLFGRVHLGNSGENWVGVAGVIAIGLIFAFTLRRTGSLWLAVGWHASFDFGETFLYSVPNSGNVFPGHLSNATLHGGDWLTGGSVGPEGSVFSFLILAMLVLAIHLLFPAKKKGLAEQPYKQTT